MANSFTYQDKTFHVGDTVNVSLKVTEADKTRNQAFQGIIISVKGAQSGKSFTVRKISTASVGVERIIPLESPIISDIELKAEGGVRRAKLYYLRDRVGKRATKVRLRRTKSENVEISQPQSKKKAKKAKKAESSKAAAKETKKSSSKKSGKSGGTSGKKASSK